MIPKGTILIIGGSEDKEDGQEPEMKSKNKDFEQFEVLKELLPINGGTRRIEVITTASDDPGKISRMYKTAFNKIGYKDVGFLNIKDKQHSAIKKACKRVKKAHAIFFTGGDQFKLSAILGGTEFVAAIKEKYYKDKNFVVAGTSAGAMVMSEIMISEGGVEEALLKKDLKTSAGLGIIGTCIVDTHFIKRGRFVRLAHAVITNPETLGIGLGEDTSLLIKKGNEAQCKGSGTVVIIDGKTINRTNITEADNETPIFVEDLKVHLLAKGIKFLLKERKLDGKIKMKKRNDKPK